MKILALSDSHGVIKPMANVVKKYGNNVACTLFLGDYVVDFEKVAESTAFHMVPGNCDFYSTLPQELTIELGGKKIWMSHGNRLGVKSGYDKIIAAAEARKVNICLFGHTHVPVVFKKNGILFLNPGSISEPRGLKRKSYAIIDITDLGVLAKVIEV